MRGNPSVRPQHARGIDAGGAKRRRDARQKGYESGHGYDRGQQEGISRTNAMELPFERASQRRRARGWRAANVGFRW